MARLQTRATTFVLQIQQQIEESLASIIDSVAYVGVCCTSYIRARPRATVEAGSCYYVLRNIKFK